MLWGTAEKWCPLLTAAVNRRFFNSTNRSFVSWEMLKAFIWTPKFQQHFKAQKLCTLHSVALYHRKQGSLSSLETEQRASTDTAVTRGPEESRGRVLEHCSALEPADPVVLKQLLTAHWQSPRTSRAQCPSKELGPRPSSDFWHSQKRRRVHLYKKMGLCWLLSCLLKWTYSCDSKLFFTSFSLCPALAGILSLLDRCQPSHVTKGGQHRGSKTYQ